MSTKFYEYGYDPVKTPDKVTPLTPQLEITLMCVVGLLMLIPCFWQPRVMAGDLPSHVYNAWLAGLVAQGKTPGLALAYPLTNVLTDIFLTPLIAAIGPAWAEALVAALAVQIFFWGAFTFVAVAAGQRNWVVAPTLAMLSYGLIFQFGFLNFYVSAGLCLWMTALLWTPTPRRIAWAAPLAVAAFAAHPLPLVWAAAVLLYVHLSRRTSDPQGRAVLLLAGAALLILAHFVLLNSFRVFWSLGGLATFAGWADLLGAGQFLLYGNEYWIPAAGTLIIWVILFLNRLDDGGILRDPLFHLWCLSILAFVFVPSVLEYSASRYPLYYIQERVSFFTVLLFCATVARGRYGGSLLRGSILLSGAFFLALYLSVHAFNQIEQEVAGLLEKVPADARVIAAFEDTSSDRLNGLVHVASAACVGRCFDYANYEPATGHFRIRVQGPNKFAAPSIATFRELEQGKHIVTAEEAPLYAICASSAAGKRFELRQLHAGEMSCKVELAANPTF
jgi:hypothetical protein